MSHRFSKLRRAVFSVLLGASVCPSAWAATPPTFPGKPVTIYTPFSLGSGPDIVLRDLAQRLSQDWKQAVKVENRPGGGGFLAIDATRRGKPDGYTLLQLDSEHLSALPHLYQQRRFNTLQHLDPVASLYRSHLLVAVSSAAPWKSLRELMAASRAHPETVSFGSWGAGSSGHLGAELLEMRAGVKTVHVSYTDMNELYHAVANQHIAWSLASVPSSQQVYKAGKIRYLAVTSNKRLPQLPDVPTVAEAGGPSGVTANAVLVLVAPKGLPSSVASKINADVTRILAEPPMRSLFTQFAYEPITWSAADIRKDAAAKSQQYEQLIKRANIQLN